MKISFSLILMLLVLSIPVIAQNSAGDVWFVPASQQILVGNTFTTEVHANSGSQSISAYGFDISYNQTVISPNISVGNFSVEPGPDGFVSAVNPNTLGILAISGFDAMGKGPGADLHVVTVNWNAVALGVSTLGNNVKDFVDPATVIIGTPNGISGSVEVTDAAYTVGDVNEDGNINITDALLISQYYVGLDPQAYTAPLEAGDANADGNVVIVDAMLVAQYYVGLITELPWPPTTMTPTPTPVDTPIPTPVDTPTPQLVEETVFAVNCGGGAYTSSDGTEYAADTGYSGGTATTNTASISGTSDPTLYNSERYGSCTYSASVPNGDLLVTLHFAENYHTQAGMRSFNVVIEGTGIISNLDVYAEAGGNTAYVTENQVAVSDGQINIEFVTVTENALINAIKVSEFISGSPKPTQEPTPTPGPTETSDPNATGNPDADAEPHGFGGSTTGGGNATAVTVSSASAFESAVGGSNSAVIIVNGILNTGDVDIGSNKTIIGANSNSGLSGGTVRVRSNNVIFRNLIIGPAGDDAMEISGATNIFIHQCTFYNGGDGNCDIVRATDYVTLSWCRFYYTSTSDHRFPVLLGNDDSATGDRGKLHVTIHHTWFDNGCIERLPRVRYGTVHLYNNLYSSNTNNYCIGLGKECHVRAEACVFVDQKQLWYDWGGSSSGEFGWSNLKLEGSSTLPSWMPNSFPVFDPGYSFTVDPVDNVKSIVMAGAGVQ